MPTNRPAKGQDRAVQAYFRMAAGMRKMGYAVGSRPLREALLDQAMEWTLLANRARGPSPSREHS